MSIVPIPPTAGRVALVAVVDPEDLAVVELLRAILPAGALRRMCLPPEVDHPPVMAPPLPPFTPRQAAILGLLAANLSNKEIGRRLAISHFTVRNHVSQILRALEVPSRQAAQALIAGRSLS